MKKRTRKNIIYKVRMWVYRLTWNDVKSLGEEIALVIAAFLMFGLLFIIPALFH